MNYTIRDLVPLLRHTPGWIYQHRAALEARGFPPPLDLPGNRLVWPRDLVDAWLRGPTTATAVDVEQATRHDRLAARARTLAGGSE